MKIIPVPLKERSYRIVAGAPLENLGPALARLKTHGDRTPKKALLVTNPVLQEQYGSFLANCLNRAGVETSAAVIPEGEDSKNLEVVQALYGFCVRAGLDRSSCVVALGGGVVGDIAGFVAATYLRGISLVHAPTSLLAMVDSSIGGKTGVDMPEAKNFVGAFHQPRLIWMDPRTLSTLPDREFANGMAEVIKYGVIADAKLFALLEKSAPLTRANTGGAIGGIIARCAAIKAGIVSKDERETKGLREILNFGHTLGHAIETVTGYRTYKHGEAISIGMCAAGRMSRGLTSWSEKDQKRMEDLLLRAKLPVKLFRKLPENKVLPVLARDKKMLAGDLRFVIAERIGKVSVRTVSAALARKGLAYVQP